MKKVFKIIIGIACTLVLLFGIFIAYCEVPYQTMDNSHGEDHTHFFRDALAANANFNNAKLTEISMLASHDSMTDQINMKSTDCPLEDTIASNKIAKALGKGLLVRYSKCQAVDAYEQLKYGVRLLDVRICYQNDTYYTSHGLISDELSNSIMKVIKFLDENPGEFVMFQITHFYAKDINELSRWQDLEDHIKSVKYNEKSLFDYVNYSDSVTTFDQLTYGDVTENGTKSGAVIYYTETVPPVGIRNLGPVYSYWHNKNTHTEIKEGMVETIKKGRELGNAYLRINQTQTTANFDKPFDALYQWSLLARASDHNAKMTKYFDKAPFDALPIYMCDFATTNNLGFNDKIIQNMIEFNSKLV